MTEDDRITATMLDVLRAKRAAAEAAAKPSAARKARRRGRRGH